VPIKVMRKDAQVTVRRAYTVYRRLIFIDAMRVIVMQIDDLTVANDTT
jgi:hypothetical protein